ncbi:MAG: dipeptide epimerase [Pseudomonadales bacterium]|nr:dipeptide epimerase [Pseudomonadales bacterium]
MRLTVEIEDWPLERPFRIAYHTFESSRLIRVELRDGDLVGRGEGGEHPQLEPLEAGRAAIVALAPRIEAGLGTAELLELMGRGPARNALDCALWDLACKRANRRLWELEGLPAPRPMRTAYTIGIAPLPEMIEDALAMRDYTLLKLKVDGSSGFEVLEAIAAARPDAEFIIDANEGWAPSQLEAFIARIADYPVRLIEQPLAKHADHALEAIDSPIPLAADESFHGLPDVTRLADRYDVINIKLDKIGGLTEALLAARAARAQGLGVMIGCNNATSLGIAPAWCVGLLCEYADLDSPLLLARDRTPPLEYRNGLVAAPDRDLWG